MPWSERPFHRVAKGGEGGAVGGGPRALWILTAFLWWVNTHLGLNNKGNVGPATLPEAWRGLGGSGFASEVRAPPPHSRKSHEPFLDPRGARGGEAELPRPGPRFPFLLGVLGGVRPASNCDSPDPARRQYFSEPRSHLFSLESVGTKSYPRA